MLRLGLCCIFVEEPIRFRTTTARVLMKFTRQEQLEKLSQICLENAENLLLALQAARKLGIGAFRILSPLFPRYTHPDVGYRLEQLPAAEKIAATLEKARDYGARHDLRLSFHPDQFVLLSSADEGVVERSLAELEYQALLAEMVGAEVINIHGGGAYGDKGKALERVQKNFARLSERARQRLTLENDDVTYTVEDLLPSCEALGLPLVYDVHHHRCNPDGLSVEQATELAARTWTDRGREPFFHLSSPKNGWKGGNPKPHADYIDPGDFPELWKTMPVTVDVEAKAKELAVVRLMGELGQGARDSVPTR